MEQALSCQQCDAIYTTRPSTSRMRFLNMINFNGDTLAAVTAYPVSRYALGISLSASHIGDVISKLQTPGVANCSYFVHVCYIVTFLCILFVSDLLFCYSFVPYSIGRFHELGVTQAMRTILQLVDE